MSLYASSVKKPVTTALIFIGVAIFGIYSFMQLTVDLYPKIELNVMTVITAYPGASASDIETNITRPIEDVLNTVENLKKITSQSRDNMSIVTLEFNYGSDLNAAANDVRDKIDLTKSRLPDETSNPIILKFSTDMIPVILYSATAKESVNALYKILDEKIANPLNRIEGVGAVSISGAPQRQIQVNVSPEKLETYNLTVEQIAQVIQMENLNVPAGNFDIGTSTFALRVESEFKESEQLLNIVLGSRGGKNIYLRDVASVADTIQSRIQETYTNEIKGATIIVQKQSGANTVSIAKKIRGVMPEIEKTLPPDIQLSMIMDTSEFTQQSIDSLTEAIFFAVLIVIVVVLFFLGRWRATVIIIVAIPVSLITSFIYLMATGSTLNIISLASISIALVLVVDDAIVVLENIAKHIERGSSAKQAAIHATNEVGIAVIASTLTIIAVFLPMTMATGFIGIFFKELGWMVTIMITMSLIVALSLTPMMCSQMLRFTNPKGGVFDRLYSPVRRVLDVLDVKYAKLVNYCVRHRWKTTIFCFALFFVITVPALKVVKMDFLPVSDNSMITLEAYLPTGTRMEVARTTGMKIDSIIKANYDKEIRIRSFSVGQADESNTWAAMQSNASNLISYRLRCIDPTLRNLNIFDIAEGIRKELDKLPELYKYTVTPGGGSGAGMGMGSSTVDVEIFGFDLNLTDQIAVELKTRLAEVEGYRDLQISRQDYRTEYQIEFDRQKLAENGLNSAIVANYVRNRINGFFTSKFREQGDEYDIVVRYDEQYRQSIRDIENIIVYNNMGNPIRIHELGKVVEKTSLPQIDRQNRQRVVKIQGTLYKVALSEVVEGVNLIIDEMRSEGKISSEIGIAIGGTYVDQQEANSGLALIGGLCIILVFIVMASQFESLTYPFIIVLSLTFGVAGVLLSLLITGTTLSLMSMIGMVMLIGIVVKNGIVFIDYANLNRERGMSVDKAIVSAGRSRLRPILMTAFTTILGMIPLALSRGVGSAMWQPMGISIIGGLTFSTILTLLYVPALYSIFGSIGIWWSRRKHRKQLITKS